MPIELESVEKFQPNEVDFAGNFGNRSSHSLEPAQLLRIGKTLENELFLRQILLTFFVSTSPPARL
ncbi:MAG: hypothetical protein D6728_18805 [Cyanobacteria bacterium J055]|nr:MAG: hypothetical protein D6728_18805 [Cyanobacteria bacterium J055]